MEYDEQVSARLDMSLDEIIGQEQQDGSSQFKKRRARGAPQGLTSPPPPAANSSPSRPLPTVQTDFTKRAAPLAPPHVGGQTSFPSRPAPPTRSLPPPARAPSGRLPGAPFFGVGPRQPFPVPVGPPRMDARWPRPRHLGGSYLVPPSGVQPPPPPIGAGPPGPPRSFPLPPRPTASGEYDYPPRRPMFGPYASPPRPLWKRSRVPDAVQDINGNHSPACNPMGYALGPPAFAPSSGPSPHLVDETKGAASNQMSYGYGPMYPPSAAYYESPYSGDAAGDRSRAYPMAHEKIVAPPGHCSHSNNQEGVWKGQSPPDQCATAPAFRGVPVRGAAATAAGSAAAGDASLAERMEFTVIVSNVPKDLPAVEIQEAFSCMGIVLRTDIMLNSKGEHTGRVCIAYASADAAKAAVAQFDKGDLNGNTIRVFAE
ncbi:RNA binding motif-containing protein [Cyclospora cayetanensis]|uniref:RNA binding motif-containing protein n=1 Tax=Cyclospora cayetanensis TaxID=88456 RepID=A0A1D3CX89_9EIME|nr:RNA binding motif-containing protein [Cyclospora cayetanensis]